MKKWALFLDRPASSWMFGILAFLVAIPGAQPFANGWNDGSRLAAVESLIGRYTHAIDSSPFVDPRPAMARGVYPYSPALPALQEGTKDKLLIGGHWYSDKPAVISLLLAGLYRLGMPLGFPSPTDRPDLFAWWLTVLTACGAYGLAVGAVWRLGQILKLSRNLRLVWIGSFALATFALAYTRHVNNHIMFLGLAAVLWVNLVQTTRSLEIGRIAWLRLATIGLLGGLAFNLDFAAGPLLLLALTAWVLLRFRLGQPVLVFGLASGPWVLLALAFNQSLGGVWIPINMVAQYQRWPGSPFDVHNMTGVVRSAGLRDWIYPLAMLFGKHGFFNHNLPLLLLPFAFSRLVRPVGYRLELGCGLAWCAATWLAYGFLSNNYSGASCSIRWFLPFLVPMFLVLGLHLSQRPNQVLYFVLLSFWGTVLGLIMWWGGPFRLRMVEYLWPIVSAALVTCLAGRIAVRAGNALRWRKFLPPSTASGPRISRLVVNRYHGDVIEGGKSRENGSSPDYPINPGIGSAI